MHLKLETITYDPEWGFALTSFWLFVPPQFDERGKVKSEAFYKKKTATLRAKNEVLHIYYIFVSIVPKYQIIIRGNYM